MPENSGRSAKMMKTGRKISQEIRKKSGNTCREKGKMFIRKGNSFRKMRILLLKKTVESFKNYGNGKKSFLLHTKKDLKDIRMARKDIPEKRWRKQKKQIFLFKKSWGSAKKIWKWKEKNLSDYTWNKVKCPINEEKHI